MCTQVNRVQKAAVEYERVTVSDKARAVVALQMKATFLPGQLGAIQDLQRNAFAHGFLTALRKLGESDVY